MIPRPKYSESFACTPDDARRARKAVTRFAEGWLAGAESAEFESAVGEALANVVEHGKCSQLTVACTYARERLVAEIAQNGRGFEPPLDRRAPAPGATRGYGLFIMQSLLDRLEFHEHGTRVRLIKRVPGDPVKAPAESSPRRGR